MGEKKFCNDTVVAAELKCSMNTLMESHEQFTRLWTEAQPVVAAYLQAALPDFHQAEDLLQEVAVVLLRKFPEYDRTRPFLGWALGVARFEILNARRAYARSRLFFEPEALERLSQTCEELAPELELRARALRECMDKVEGRARELLRLRYEEALKPNSIASQLGLAVVAVRVMLSRTRAALRQCIERKLKQEGAS
jgi:RNA polymerase sigma-70 factor, ECF subfamily